MKILYFLCKQFFNHLVGIKKGSGWKISPRLGMGQCTSAWYVVLLPPKVPPSTLCQVRDKSKVSEGADN